MRLSHAIPLFVFVLGCNNPQTTTVEQLDMAVAPDMTAFRYAPLPEQAEWDVKLDPPLKVTDPEIWSAHMPEPVWTTFPIPETTYSDGPNGTIRMHMPYQVGAVEGSYGIDRNGCISDALIHQVKHYGGVGLAGGQYGWYQRVNLINPYAVFNPTHWWYLIYYNGFYLDITFPDLGTMHVRKLAKPDMSKAPSYCRSLRP